MYHTFMVRSGVNDSEKGYYLLAAVIVDHPQPLFEMTSYLDFGLKLVACGMNRRLATSVA